MTQDEAVFHWQKRARTELKAAQTLFGKNDVDLYGEVLFHCHLALELGMKAAFIKQKNAAAPFTHDLGELANILQEQWTQIERNDFETITDFAILSRYGDEEWYTKKATRETASVWLEKTEKYLSRILHS